MKLNAEQIAAIERVLTEAEEGRKHFAIAYDLGLPGAPTYHQISGFLGVLRACGVNPVRRGRGRRPYAANRAELRARKARREASA